MWYCIEALYVLISLGFGLVAYNTNGKLSIAPRWQRALYGLAIALIWPGLLVFALGMGLYQSWNKRA